MYIWGSFHHVWLGASWVIALYYRRFHFNLVRIRLNFSLTISLLHNKSSYCQCQHRSLSIHSMAFYIRLIMILEIYHILSTYYDNNLWRQFLHNGTLITCLDLQADACHSGTLSIVWQFGMVASRKRILLKWPAASL